MDYSPPDSSIHGILQARILEWVAIPFFREWIFPNQGLNPGLLHCRWFLTIWASREACIDISLTPKVYTGAYSWCYTFYRFGYM